MNTSLFGKRWGWRLLIIAVLCLVLFLLRYRSVSLPNIVNTSAPSVVDQAELHQGWQGQVQVILDEYDVHHDPVNAQTSLLHLTVARQDQAVHLALVLAFYGLANSKPGSVEKLQQARRVFQETLLQKS